MYVTKLLEVNFGHDFNFSKHVESVVAICNQTFLVLKKQCLGVHALDSMFNAIVLNKILCALPVYFGYLTEIHKNISRRVLERANRMGFTFHGYDLDHLSETSQYKLFRHIWSERHCFHHLITVKSRPSGAMHLSQRGTISFSQALNMNLTSAILLLVRFLIMFNICVFVLYVLRDLISHPQCCRPNFRVVNMCACHVYLIINLLTYLST